MKYFLDTEFLEGPQKEKFPISLFRKHTPNTIDLISIVIVAEDGREYYAISKDFNLEEAWNRFQLEEQSGDMRNIFPEGKKIYWIRENVLKPIFKELYNKSVEDDTFIKNHFGYAGTGFSLGHFKALIKHYGKTNTQIADEIKFFCRHPNNLSFTVTNPEFYAYYADYDWVVFCWLFGKMMDLPDGFPMYCRDLKQVFDQKEDWLRIPTSRQHMDLKAHTHYPKQDPSKSHNAIEDARWNKKLYEFLNKV